ncbi:hypothetical protein HanIR_Chr08g0343921 [Helianthus annuus]|nr:hypothetical protein HanIR_Chr08g0343921 [Helianthus annuus]
MPFSINPRNKNTFFGYRNKPNETESNKTLVKRHLFEYETKRKEPNENEQ